MQLLTKYQNENRDDHVERNIVDFTFLLIFVSLCMLCFCYSVYCLYLQQMQPEEMSDQQAEQEDHGEGVVWILNSHLRFTLCFLCI